MWPGSLEPRIKGKELVSLHRTRIALIRGAILARPLLLAARPWSGHSFHLLERTVALWASIPKGLIRQPPFLGPSTFNLVYLRSCAPRSILAIPVVQVEKAIVVESPAETLLVVWLWPLSGHPPYQMTFMRMCDQDESRSNLCSGHYSLYV